MTEFRNALEEGDTRAHVHIIRLLWNANETEEATEYAINAHAAGHEGALGILAEIFEKQGRHEAVIQLYEQTVSGGSPTARLSLARFLHRTGSVEAAIQQCKQALADGVWDARVWLARWSLEDKGQANEAITELIAIIRAGDELVGCALAEMLSQHGKTTESNLLRRYGLDQYGRIVSSHTDG